MYPRQIDQINNSALEALSFSEALIAKAVPLGINALGALAILLIGLFLAAAIRRGTRNAFNRTSRIDETVASFLSSLIYYGVVAMVLYAVLTRFGIPTTSLAAMLGAAGLAIALALQGTLGNVASGVMLMIFRPFRLGDYVQVAGVEGTVKDINLFMTEMATIDNKRVLVPNGKIFDGAITNFTGNTKRRLDLLFGISYDSDIDQAQSIIRGLMKAEARIHTDPEALVEVDSLGDFSVNLTTRMWVDTSDYSAVKWALTKAVKLQFDAQNIAIPFPTVTQYNHQR